MSYSPSVDMATEMHIICDNYGALISSFSVCCFGRLFFISLIILQQLIIVGFVEFVGSVPST